MPRRPSDIPLRKVTFDAGAEDWDRLRELHGAQNVAKVVRKLIHAHIEAVESRRQGLQFQEEFEDD